MRDPGRLKHVLWVCLLWVLGALTCPGRLWVEEALGQVGRDSWSSDAWRATREWTKVDPGMLFSLLATFNMANGTRFNLKIPCHDFCEEGVHKVCPERYPAMQYEK